MQEEIYEASSSKIKNMLMRNVDLISSQHPVIRMEKRIVIVLDTSCSYRFVSFLPNAQGQNIVVKYYRKFFLENNKC